eukprot:1810450-Prymnesium_polylepis.1
MAVSKVQEAARAAARGVRRHGLRPVLARGGRGFGAVTRSARGAPGGARTARVLPRAACRGRRVGRGCAGGEEAVAGGCAAVRGRGGS